MNRKQSRPQRCIERINKALKHTGHRLVRNTRGGSYYYLIRDHAGPVDQPTVTCSIYCYALEPTDKDFLYAADYINVAFREAGRKQPIDVNL